MVLLVAVAFAIVEAAVRIGALDPRWIVAFDTPPSAAAGFDATTAFVPLRGGKLVAVDLDRGTVRWSIDLVTTLTPATGDGLVFTATEGVIEARDAQTGATRWHTPLPGGAAAPLYWDTGWLIASTPAGDLVALRAANGEVLWRQPLGAPLAAPPAPALDRLYVALIDGRLLSVSLATGETLWSRQFAGRVTGLMALSDQLVFGTTEKAVHSTDLMHGRERWRWRVGGDVTGLPAADARHIYFASRDNLLRAVDRSSGNLRWVAPLPSRPSGGPLLAGGAVMVPFVSSEIAGFDPATGKAALTITAAGDIGAQPYLRMTTRATATRLITVSRDGQLQGFAVRAEPAPAPMTELPGARAVP